MHRPHKNHFSGCVIGQCLGDALGVLREGWPREDCEVYVAGPLRSWLQGQLDENAWSGQYTDDSQLARELMQSFVDCGEFNPADYAKRIAAIFVEDRIVGRGMTTHHAAMRLAAGLSWDEAGTPAPAAGNGSAMRAGPIGLMFGDVRHVIQAACDQGRITHQDPRASAGAVAIAIAVHLALRSKTIDPPAFVSQLAEFTATIDKGFAESLRQLSDFWELSVEEAVDRIAVLGQEPGAKSDWDRISPFVVPSVIWSLYAFLKSPDDYAAAVSTAIRVGGDVDTTAAMTGAISGAYLGLDALPAHLAERVHDRGTWGYKALVSLSHRCFELSAGR
ncbi:ADP-ribosylglycohydrolase family protein [Stieleria sp. ICT_E10.1]|uniref:ADP-ribosylglycohydrolase family protein n=1 Tax=Stieleria sedimenti TaxID=2976331 RepID=UPI00217FE26C|nr:ADP-ribosylglycohydrolase family protein [Stieleria sedimenti]MCS7466940.1 ADP-ribosylglycohydrolase family protein [Stieleria sedimenti]